MYEKSLKLYQRASLILGEPVYLEGLARVAAAKGRPERASRLCGAAAALREELGALHSPLAARRAEHDRTVAAARAALGEDAFESAWAKGHALPFEEAIDAALGDE